MTDALRPVDLRLPRRAKRRLRARHRLPRQDRPPLPGGRSNGKLDIAKCSTYWLKDAASRGMKHICWDGCMFSNEILETPTHGNTILATMIEVDHAL